MSENTESRIEPVFSIAPSPHIANSSFTTRRMMLDVLIGLMPLVGVAFWVFGVWTAVQLGLSVAGCVAAEALFTAMRGRRAPLGDLSAVVTGLILGLSLPVTAPWYVAVIAAFTAIGLGKVVFGGLGYNIFNPAMVGRAFVMIAFPALLGASAYMVEAVEGVTQATSAATPLTIFKQEGVITPLSYLLIGKTNGSLGETSAIACLLGGLYLVLRRSASWEIPLSAIVSLGALSLLGDLFGGSDGWTALHALSGGAFLFGAFFIATDPVSSPLTHAGKFIYGAGFGALVLLIRTMSGYPEGVMFAVLLMNALAPLINRWTIPTPFGGRVPEGRA
jgi:Na+-translocating ferredoxin:NAD+ oxidoreductase subunit D